MLLQQTLTSTTTMSSQHLKLLSDQQQQQQQQQRQYQAAAQQAASSSLAATQHQHDEDGLYQKLPFPYKLHQLLEDVEKDGKQNIISWLPSGNAFKVHRPSLFTSQVMSNYFRQTQYKSFTRQLYIYGFNRVQDGPDQGAYYHPNFLRGDRMLSLSMTTCRRKKKGKPKPGPLPLNHAAMQEDCQRYSSQQLAAAGYRNSSLDSKVPSSSTKQVEDHDKAIMERHTDEDRSTRRGSLLSKPMMKTFIERNERLMEGNFNTSSHQLSTAMQHQHPRQHPYDDRHDSLGGPLLPRTLSSPSEALLQPPSKISSTTGPISCVPTGATTSPNLLIPNPSTLVERQRIGSCHGVCRCLERLIDRAFEDTDEADNTSDPVMVRPIENASALASRTGGLIRAVNDEKSSRKHAK